MQKTDTLIQTKLHPPFTRQELVTRPRLQARISEGLCHPLTLITAPAGFGKTTLVAACIAGCGMPVAWLSLDKDDNQVEHFLAYVVAALQEVGPAIGSEAAQLLAAARPAPSGAVMTSLINNLDTFGSEIALVLDDYQVISDRAVHREVAFLLDHCPKTFHLLIATRSDPPLPLARLRARGQTVELRGAELRFTETEAAQFLNEVMGLHLDAGSVTALEERTEGWIVGLQMAALSMRDRKDVRDFIQGFSGTNRYILDYLLEEVLIRQPPETQRFLLYTSILERLTAPLCDAVLATDEGSKGEDSGRSFAVHPSASILENLERANLFLVPLDDERTWYRYHHLFADLLRNQLRKSLGAQGLAQLHIRAADWLGQNGSVLEAIHHAAQAQDDVRVERFIEQHYMEMVKRGEMLGYRFWTGRLSKDLVYKRPWLSIYEAYSHAWFGELDEADRLLKAAEKRIQSNISSPDTRLMQGYLAYVKSRVTAMRGDLQQAIAFCLTAREHTPESNLALQFDTGITLGYEYFLIGDYANASDVLNEEIRSSKKAGSIIYTVAASCILARLYANQGLLHKSYETYQTAGQLISGASEEHRDASALIEVGIADVLCEWNDLDAALIHLKRGLALLPFWAKVDDLVLANIILARIHLAQADMRGATEAVEKASQIIQTSGVFSEARSAVEVAQVKLSLAQGNLKAAHRWAASRAEPSCFDEPLRFVDEPAHIALSRVFIAHNKPGEAIRLLTCLEESARSAERQGSLIEILILKALALQAEGSPEQARSALMNSLVLAEPEGYRRIFLDEGRPMQMLLSQWLAHAGSSPLRDYAVHLLSQFNAQSSVRMAAEETVSPSGGSSPGSGQALIEPLTPRELEVLQLISLGNTNREIAHQLFVAPGTVKAHAASIYRKLDVSNRVEAVARSRQLGILA